jgi:hypothetical protein
MSTKWIRIEGKTNVDKIQWNTRGITNTYIVCTMYQTLIPSDLHVLTFKINIFTWQRGKLR